MKFNGMDTEFQNKLAEDIKNSDDKASAIVEAIEKINERSHQGLISQLQEENDQIKADASRAAKLGIRTAFTKEERKFYDTLKAGARQSITADQIDIIPTSIVDRTLADVKEASDTLKLINFAPAGVQKWLFGAKTGSAAWGGLSDALTAEITATLTSMNLDVHKLHAFCVIPKAIRELETGVVDKYFTAVLNEAMHDGIVSGYLNGDGLTGPIGILRKNGAGDVDASGKRTAKAAATTITGFTPKQLAPVKKALSNDGKRKFDKIYIIANPADAADYVDPALYYFNGYGYVPATKTPIEVIEEPMMTQGTAAFTIEGHYTMGFTGVKVEEYKETKAMDDADLIVAKVLGNGRADDDNVAYVFDPTKLVEFVPKVNNTGN